MKFFLVLTALLSLLQFTQSNAHQLPLETPLCKKFSSQSIEIRTLFSLAKKLDYSPSELCSHKRVLDIQKEYRRRNTLTVTLHYSDYSCEYNRDLIQNTWLDSLSRCYPTW